MNTTRAVRAAVAVLCALTLPACLGDGSDGNGPADAPVDAPAGYVAEFLVANKADLPSPQRPAAVTDTNLVNPWGLAFGPPTPAWVANAGTDTSTLYDGAGALKRTVALPAGSAPTGVVFNNSPNAGDFNFMSNNNVVRATFIFAGKGGTLDAWSNAANADGANATTVFTSTVGAVYMGLAIAERPGTGHFLYATDFHNGAVVVFDSTFTRVPFPNPPFQDANLPAGFKPFGIQELNGRLYVSYARGSAADPDQPELGAGLGVVNEFDFAGNHLRRLIPAGGPLNAPWGMAIAPGDFGTLSNHLLVGSFGDGTISAFNPNDGQFVRKLNRQGSADAIVVPGLWGLAFGNDAPNLNQPHNALFFTAGFNNEADGLFGRINCGC